jgi:dihydroorotate dehydrogenase (NAD+) catalytic subunit
LDWFKVIISQIQKGGIAMQINGNKTGFIPVKILEKRRIHGDSQTFAMDFEWPIFKEDPLPGQFILVKISDTELPIPISIAQFGDDRITTYIKAVGNGTENITMRKTNTRIEIAGPFGNGFKIEPEKNYLLVGGGIGAAPLLFIAQQLESEPNHISAVIGARTNSDLLNDPFFSFDMNVKTVTDEMDGPVTNFMQREIDYIQHLFGLDNLEIVTCGPWPMMKKVAEIAKTNGLRCHVILEEMIICGVGSCKGCGIQLKGGHVVELCQHGPVMDGHLIDWNATKKKKLIELPERKAAAISSQDNPLAITLLGQEGRKLFLRYPFMNASKGVGITALKKGYVKADYLGAYVTEGITSGHRDGNPSPRVREIPGGLINAIGLQNEGVRPFIQEDLPFLESLGIPIIINISGNTIDEFEFVASELASYKSSATLALEINISCPNNRLGRQEIFAVSPDETYAVVSTVRKVSKDLFLIVKLSPSASNIVAIGKKAVLAGADALSAINTLPGTDVDPYSLKVKISGGMGGISGTAIRHLAYRCISQLYQANLGVPLIGIGGINDAESNFKMHVFGANATAACTAFYTNPNLPVEIKTGLSNFMSIHNASHIQELIGRAKYSN